MSNAYDFETYDERTSSQYEEYITGQSHLSATDLLFDPSEHRERG